MAAPEERPHSSVLEGPLWAGSCRQSSDAAASGPQTSLAKEVIVVARASYASCFLFLCFLPEGGEADSLFSPTLVSNEAARGERCEPPSEDALDDTDPLPPATLFTRLDRVRVENEAQLGQLDGSALEATACSGPRHTTQRVWLSSIGIFPLQFVQS